VGTQKINQYKSINYKKTSFLLARDHHPKEEKRGKYVWRTGFENHKKSP
jgi:hypothetical protein